jgi:tetratricopeptide (TPR) repeat protein
MRSNIDGGRILRLRSFVLAATLMVSCVVQGQTGGPPEPATVQGLVRGVDHYPVAGATVSLQAKDRQTLTVRTDSTGAYRFSALSSGVYTLHAEMAGQGEATSGSFALGPKESITIDLNLASAKATVPQNSLVKQPEFFDEPHFTVAGVADTTNLGGHGSDVIVRNREALAQETAALRKQVTTKDSDSIAEQHHLAADADEKAGKPLDAVREYQNAAELNPSETNLFDWGAELLLHRAAEPAIEVFTKGNRSFPRSVRMLVGLGAAWYSRGSYDQAAQRFCEASDLNPEDPNPYLFMGRMQTAETVDSPAIVERLGRFARLEPQNSLANYYYAVALWKQYKSVDEMKDLELVKSLLEKAVHLDPKLGLAHLQLGILYSEQGDIPKAISAYQRAIEASPQLEQAHYRLAQAYKRVGQTAKAHTEIQQYERISNEKAQEVDRQRRELQQFVYKMRDEMPASPPQ